MIKVYGIKNCNTVKKALSWLMENDIKYQFFDYKKDGVDVMQLEKFVDKFGWEKVLNRKGTTWRQLSLDEQKKVVSKESAIALMQEKMSIIKRPLIDLGNGQLMGFDESEYVAAFLTKLKI